MGKIAVIDVGTTKIVTIIGENTDDGKLKILKWKQTLSAGIENGNVVNIPLIVHKIKENINYISDYITTNKEFFVGVAGQYIHVKRVKTNLNFDRERTIDIDIIKKLEKTASNIHINEDEEIVAVLHSSFLLDDEKVLKNPIDLKVKSSIEGDFLLVIAKITNLSNLKTSVTSAGIKIKNFYLEPMASAEAVLRDDEKKSCVAMIDIGGGTSDLAVYENNKLMYMAVIPMGGRYITNSLAEKFSIDEDLAEKIKIEFGINYVKDVVFHNKITQKSIKSEDVFQNICDSYKKIFSALVFKLKTIQYKDKIKKLIITGGGGSIKNLPQLANYCVGCEIRIAGPILKTDNTNLAQLQEPQFATVFGLLLLANQEQHNEIDTQNGKETSKEDTERKTNLFSKFFTKGGGIFE